MCTHLQIERAIAGVVLAIFFALGGVICVVPDRSAILTDVPAEELAAIDTGDTAWIVVASALVLLMTPGIAFFYVSWESAPCFDRIMALVHMVFKLHCTLAT